MRNPQAVAKNLLAPRKPGKARHLLPKRFFFVVLFIFASLACQLLTPDQREVFFDEETGEEIITYSPDQDELIDAYLDEVLDTLTDADGCDRTEVRQKVEDAFADCSKIYNQSEDIRGCIADREAAYTAEIKQLCEPTAPETLPENEGSADPEGALTLLAHEPALIVCTKEPAGHFFGLGCEFSITVDVEYEISTLPGSITCRAGALSFAGVSAIALTELSGNATVTVDIPVIKTLYEDADGDGGADAPSTDNTNPAPGEDGRYVDLSCFVGPVEYLDSWAWDKFACLTPDKAEEGCVGPWLDFSQGHD